MKVFDLRTNRQSTAGVAPKSSLLDRKELAWIWLPIRVYLGFQWLAAGRAKLGSPAWMRTGLALKGFWQHAVNGPVGGPHGVVYYGWYHAFLQFMLVHQWYPWFARLIAVGETSVGILLILGACTGVAAALGATMNFNYMLAGSLSSNPVLFALAIVLILRWRIAGFVGLDAFLQRVLRRGGQAAPRRPVWGTAPETAPQSAGVGGASNSLASLIRRQRFALRGPAALLIAAALLATAAGGARASGNVLTSSGPVSAAWCSAHHPPQAPPQRCSSPLPGALGGNEPPHLPHPPIALQ